MCGCDVTKQLGCFESCKPIKTGVNAPETGVWVARTCFNGVWLKKEIQVTTGQEITVPNDYPEDMLLKMQLLQADGAVHNNETFSFTIKISIAR